MVNTAVGKYIVFEKVFSISILTTENAPECVDTCGDHKPVNATTEAECDEYTDCCFKDGKCIQLSTSGILAITDR